MLSPIWQQQQWTGSSTGSLFTSWVLYTMHYLLPLQCIVLFLEILMMYLKSNDPKPPSSAVGYSYVELWVIALFTISHCFMFLYPCFKAAAVTACVLRQADQERLSSAVTVSREKLIKKDSGNESLLSVIIQVVFTWMMTESSFSSSTDLKNKKYWFHISFFCAWLQFSFNIAYISIFIGLLGVLLKVTGVF